MGVSLVDLRGYRCYDNGFFSLGFRDTVELPVASVGIRQYRAVGMGGCLGTAQIVVGLLCGESFYATILRTPDRCKDPGRYPYCSLFFMFHRFAGLAIIGKVRYYSASKIIFSLMAPFDRISCQQIGFSNMRYDVI